MLVLVLGSFFFLTNHLSIYKGESEEKTKGKLWWERVNKKLHIFFFQLSENLSLLLMTERARKKHQTDFFVFPSFPTIMRTRNEKCDPQQWMREYSKQKPTKKNDFSNKIIQIKKGAFLSKFPRSAAFNIDCAIQQFSLFRFR